MREILNIDKAWLFLKGVKEIADFNAKKAEKVDLPHNWNSIDGQDGGGDYFRGKSVYQKILKKDDLPQGTKKFIEFDGVNSVSDVYFNGKHLGHHEGGYSKFRYELTDIKDENELLVLVDNSENLAVYPHKADFTFYGGIYRSVKLLGVNENHFELLNFGDLGMKILAQVDGKDGKVTVDAKVVGKGDVFFNLKDDKGTVVGVGKNNEALVVKDVHLWHGVKDPYLYTITVQLIVDGNIEDEITKRIGFRTFKVDPKLGFFLNGEQYPLRGVCRHQDRKGMGNSITKKEHDEDFQMIKDIGANTIRLAHYQHDDYIYDLCDEIGLVAWAEIPYISLHSEAANGNAEQQMTELVLQQYHHACIVCWGTSNEITMFRGHQKQLVAENKKLNDLCHQLDPYRLTTMACFAMCSMDNGVTKITDLVSWNFYFGWYTPFMILNELWFGAYHFLHPKTCVGLSEYGAEAMTNLHSQHPHRGDSTEEYQNVYHEHMLKFFEKRPYLWATHVWNMFDFGSDGRNQGGDPGVNHKGLVTFDRKTKKDAYYLYRSYWSNEPTLYIAERRMEYRTGNTLRVKVYTNQKDVVLTANGVEYKTKSTGKILIYNIPFNKEAEVVVKAKGVQDKVTFKQVDKPYMGYKLQTKSNNYSWEKK